MSESLLDISKALKCQVCGKYIRDYKELHKYNTCSVNCYNHVYYLKFTKEKRKNERIDDYKRKINYLNKRIDDYKREINYLNKITCKGE